MEARQVKSKFEIIDTLLDEAIKEMEAITLKLNKTASLLKQKNTLKRTEKR